MTANSFNGTRCEAYYRMFDLVARHGPGCTIMSDGWTDKNRRSICNFLANSRKGTVFIDSIDTSEFSKNTAKVFEMIDNIVEKVGEKKVIQVVTDNASAYKVAGNKDLDKHLKVHKTTIEKGRKITNYIYASSLLISMLRESTQGRDLIRPGATRFSTTYLTLTCLSEHNGSLMTMFSSEARKKSNFSSNPKGKKGPSNSFRSWIFD
ncbi:hypothetical protein LINGRAHAP2_LOCUS24137 [Linum grandiflorum]